MYRLLLLCILISCCPVSLLAGKPVFDFNEHCLKAYRQLMALRLEEAQIVLASERAKNPDNLVPDYLSDYGDCLKLLFNGNPSDYTALKPKLDQRLNLMEKGSEKSPWYLFCKANINLHWALVYLRFGDNFKAGMRFRKSFLQLKENKASFPKFEEQDVLIGLEQAIAGAIPENYKWLGEIMGIKGDIHKGIATITQYLNTHPDGNGAMYEEAMIYYAYLKFYLQSNPESAWKFLSSPAYNETGNLMRSFIKANIALNYRKAGIAHDILSKASHIEAFDAFPILHYEIGEALMYQLDFDCVPHYLSFLKTYKGRNFTPDAWLKLAWVAYLSGNRKQAGDYLSQISRTTNPLTDADKQACRFAAKPVWPLPALLEVRLLIDGGLYRKALERIQSIDKKQLVHKSHTLEYNFRYGRIFEELNQYDNALIFYTATINTGRNEKDYFAARAALQKGFIYEKTGRKAEAIAQFKDCLSMRNHDLQSSIDQLAKAGLNRLGSN